MSKKPLSSLMTSVDELFTTQEEREISARESLIEIPLDQIHDFPGHPFRVNIDSAMEELVESVRQFGVLVPAMVRARAEGGYEMIAGHRRKLACRLAGKHTIPCLVRDMSDDEAVIIMVDSNLQRETLLPSEKAFAYKMKLEAARRRQGARTDLEDSPSSGKSTREILAENSPDSHEQIRRYIRLTSLVRSLLDRVDLGKLPMRTAVELSYLREPEQVELDAILTARGKVPSFAQATRLRTLSEKDPLTRGDILAELDSDKKEKKAPPVKIPRSSVNRFFSPDASEKDITEAIVKALELYRIQGGKMP